MRKHISIIATAIITGSIAMAGAMSSFATEDLTPGMPLSTNHCTEMSQFETETVSIDAVQFKADEVQAPTEAPTEAPTQAPTEAPTEAPIVTTEAVVTNIPTATTAAVIDRSTPDIDEETAIGEALLQAGKQFKHVSSEWVVTEDDSYWRIGVSDATKEKAPVVYYHVNKFYATAETAPATTAAATTTKNAATTAAKKAADKNGSPKTGVAIPAIPVAGLAIAAVAVAFTLKKKSN